MRKDKVKDRFRRYLEDEISADDLRLLSTDIQNERYTPVFNALLEEAYQHPDFVEEDESVRAEVFGVIHGKIQQDKKIKRRRLWSFTAAAAILLLISISALFFQTWQKSQEKQAADYAQIKAGGNKAVLTLSNGSMITLTDAANGTLAQQSGVQITKTADGQIIYEVSASNHPASLSHSSRPVSLAPPGRGGKAGEGVDHSNNSSLPSGISPQRGERGVALNTIETPRGGQYQVRLPDGSKVWLNAASKLTYPVSFHGREDRQVELSGEAYFEIAKDKQHPFRVKSAGQEVEVLGTHFNINSYSDEQAIKTTLLEGSVKVSSSSLQSSSPQSSSPQSSLRGGTTKQPHTSKQVASSLRFPHNDGVNGIVLKPGEQSILTRHAIKVVPVLAESSIDWKEGIFSFKNEDLRAVMRKISRWYDVQVIYSSSLTENQTFAGTISRSDQISKVLKILEEGSNFHFRIEGRKIYVEL